jgi:surface protein
VFDSSFKEYIPDTLEAWFYGMDNLVEVKGTENLDATALDSTESLFEACSSLKTLDLSTWYTPCLENAFGMFRGCSSLESLNIAKLDTSSTMDLYCLFDGCSSLKSVTLGRNFAFTEGVEPVEEVTPAIFPTPDTEYGTWWRGEGKAYTPEELRGFARGELEGTWTWYMGEQPKPASVNMFRLYNPNTGEHFYTSNTGERDATVAAGWKSEGVGWKAPSTSNTPVYRLYNEHSGGEHHYTMSKGERDSLIAAGWKDEGIGWYSDDAKSVPVYREYNPNQIACNHNFTTSKNEHDTLVKLGWKDEGTAWYGVS